MIVPDAGVDAGPSPEGARAGRVHAGAACAAGGAAGQVWGAEGTRARAAGKAGRGYIDTTMLCRCCRWRITGPQVRLAGATSRVRA